VGEFSYVTYLEKSPPGVHYHSIPTASGTISKERSMMQQRPHPVMILRRKQVEQRTGLSRSTINLRAAQGDFPKAVSLGARAVGWLESEVEEWLNSRVQLSRG
jgi:prophage regulatory protein